jgi:hypothetical protein
MVDFEQSAAYREALAEPRQRDPGAVNREIQILADDVLVHHGLRAPAPKPQEASRSYVARLGETFEPFVSPERRGLDRHAMAFADAAEMLRVDLDQARQEIERPFHSLKDGEIREVIRLDDGGRPVHTWHSRTEGPSFWMDQFAPPMRCYVSGGSDGIATPRHLPPEGYVFDKSDLPEYVELRRLAAYQDSAEFKIIEAYAAAGKEPPPEVLAKVRAPK